MVDRVVSSDLTYLKAETVSIDRRMEALAYVLDCVKRSYGHEGIALRNLAALVDGVADAVASDDTPATLVRGLRLLDLAELDHVVGVPRGAAS